MKKLFLSKKLRFRLESVGEESIVFCYDERINEYFAMDAKYYAALSMLEEGSSESELRSRCDGVNTDLLLRGLRYRRLLVETGEGLGSD